MKLVTIPELEKSPEAYIDMARKETVVITAQGKAVARLVAIVDGEEVSPATDHAK